MKALQYRRFGALPEVVDVPVPVPEPGQVLLSVSAAGLCHSDLHIMEATESEYRFGPLPLTLGHEAAGVVAALGEGADKFSVGDQVLVYGPWGCGQCPHCAHGKENYCTHPDGVRPPGIAVPGALADYVLVDAERHLVPLGGLDPVQAVSLTDAGLSSYHAVKQSLPKLTAGSHAVVIGAGGLGHIAIQIIRALSAASVIAVDVSEDKLGFALEVGAHQAVPSDEHAPAVIRKLTRGFGAMAVFDFVGAQQTIELAARAIATEGEITVVGAGVGAIPVGYRTLPFDASIRAPFWGSRHELWEVVELARSGHLRVEVEQCSLEEAPFFYERLKRGQIRGRAVATPGSREP